MGMPGVDVLNIFEVNRHSRPPIRGQVSIDMIILYRNLNPAI